MIRFLFLSIIFGYFFIFYTNCSKSKESNPPSSLLYDTSIYVPQVYSKKPVLYQKPLSPEASLSHFQVLEGFSVELFASEPDVVNPIAISWDHLGRLWVIESLDYPHGDESYFSRIKILEDTDFDGKADLVKVFADSLKMATSLTFSNGGVIVAQAPDLIFLKDTNGDDRADQRDILITGWGTYDTHAGPSNLKYGFDNKIWGAVGYAGFKGVGKNTGISFSQGIFNFNSNGSDLAFYSQFSNNTWGLGFSESFEVFGSTANNEHAIHVGIPYFFYETISEISYHGAKNISSHYKAHPILKNWRQVDFQGGFTASAGFSFYNARSFPKEYWNKIAFVCEPTAGIVHRAIIQKTGSFYKEKDGKNIIASSDEWFSPVHAEVGPDGALWVADWYNFIIQHNPVPAGFQPGEGNAYINPLRDKKHGRIYRIVYNDSKESSPPTITLNDPQSLVKILDHSNQFWRFQAQRLLVEGNHQTVIPDLIKIVQASNEENWISAIHALWTLKGLSIFEKEYDLTESFLFKLLSHPHPAIRKTAVNIAPNDINTLNAILDNDLLRDKNFNTRLHTIIKCFELPSRPDFIQKLIVLSQNEENFSDPFISEALYLAFTHHKEETLKTLSSNKKNNDNILLLKGLEAGWHLPDYNTSTWAPIETGKTFEEQIPELKSFNGTIWYRTQINLPAFNPSDNFSISLGAIDNSDFTYINGVHIGTTIDKWAEKRLYQIPKGVLKTGLNTIAIKVEDLRDVGGVTGKKDEIYIQLGKDKMLIPNNWQYHIESNLDKKSPVFSKPDDLLDFFIKAIKIKKRKSENKVINESLITFTLKPLNGKIRFDQDSINVQAGKNIQIVFDNTDHMAHNLIIGRPSSLETIGKASEKLINDLSYIPNTKDVLFSLPPLAPREKQSISFIAPQEPGDYVFVCTLPGHWRTMNGVIRVK